MKQPKVLVIPFFEDLASDPSQSQLRELAEKQKQGKIKIWPDRPKWALGGSNL